jgi:hypothetical protein
MEAAAMKTKHAINDMQEQMIQIVVSFIRAREEADRCEEDYRKAKQLPDCESEAAAHRKKARELSRRADELLKKYERLKQVQ